MNLQNRLKGVCLYSLVAALILCLGLLWGPGANPAWGQSSSTGTISGTASDSTGAVVPGATVTLVDISTKSIRTTTTNERGLYVFPYVLPAIYDVKVTKQGFKTTIVAKQTVEDGTQLTVDVKLEVGSVTTTIEVTVAAGTELQTLNATVGATLSGATMINLPNTTRDASTLATLQPGQNINGATGGSEVDQNSFQLDGGFATDDMSGDNNTYITSFSGDTTGGTGTMHSPGFAQSPSAVVPMPVASIEDFKVSTSNQTADFSGGAGSQVQVVTKRGKDTFHGGAYEYYLDNNFGGANTWDNNAARIKQPTSFFNRFGADAGGKIPHSNFLGGSWYIFGLYEGFRFPQSSSFTESFPLPSLRAGLIHDNNGNAINLNPFAVVDPGCGAITSGTCKIATTGQTIQPTVCPAGACDPRGLGLNPVICKPGATVGSCSSGVWSMVPLPNNCGSGDRLNYCGYTSPIATPQTSNFGVVRIDHDFPANWKFNATYHYYELNKTVADQWDIGGFFPGDTFGKYSAIRHKPQNPWLYTAGLTKDIKPGITNDFHFSYTRNFWAYGDPSGVPNTAGYPANLEIGGEQSGVYGPYDTYNQGTRTRFWDGHDWLYRDDVTWVKGNHLMQFGGSYLRNVDTHNRNDNGQSINTFEQYIVGSGNGTPLSVYGIDMTGYKPGGFSLSSNKYGNLYSMILGMVDETQSLYTRGLGTTTSGLPLLARTSCAIAGIAATADCIGSPPLTNTSILPTYNWYWGDSWHMRPSLTVNFGVGYTIEMPPYETRGGVETVLVDQNNRILQGQQLLNNIQQFALQGQGYAPLIGFSTIRNVNDHNKYPYNPFYGGISPRLGLAWNFAHNSVLRLGYSRIYGRVNGVDPVLTPMLTPGLMQPATCGGPGAPSQFEGATNICGGTTPANVFRVGKDCPAAGPCFAPLPPPSANLPQPWFPGVNDVATGSGEGLDPNFKPNRSDEFTVTIQHQFGPKILAEGGYIGRFINNEVEYYSYTVVPYMMTQGGQTFGNAWANTMVRSNYGTGIVAGKNQQNFSNPNGNLDFSTIAAQPFFEAGVKPGYLTATNAAIANFNTTNGAGTGCPGPSCIYPINPCPNLTCAFVTNQGSGPLGNGDMFISDPFDAWAAVSNAGMFNFGRSFTSDPIPATCSTINPAATTTIGCNGQTPSLSTTISNGYGNYHAGYLQLTFTDWHGLTMKTNFTYSHALGTGNVVQATSSYATLDNWNLHNQYGPQTYDEALNFNLFLNYAVPWYSSQKGVLGRLLGGWSIAPLFTYGSGFPVELNTANFDCGSFGQCNTAYVGSQESMVIPNSLRNSYTATRNNGVNGGTGAASTCGTTGFHVNVFSPAGIAASCPVNGGIFGDPVRNPILGLDGQAGLAQFLRGLPFFNLDVGITKKIKVTERVSGSLYFDFVNVLNHMQPVDPSFNAYDVTSWGSISGQANTPRRFQIGLSVDW